MNRFFIIRHGETERNKKGICQGIINNHLDEKGFEDAYKIAYKLKETGIKFDVFIATPLVRTIETLSIIKYVLNDTSPININKEIIERNFGGLEGQDVDLVTKEIEKKTYNDNKGFESDDVLIERIKNAYSKINSEYENKNILIVSHSHAIKALLSSIDPNKYNFFTKYPNLNTCLIESKDNKFKVKELYFLNIENN